MTGRPGRAPVARWRRLAVTAMPAVVPPVMTVVFRRLARRYGTRRGYQAALVCYWAACALLPPLLAGPGRLRRLLSRPTGALPAPRWLALAVLCVPPAGAVATELVPQLRSADASTVATALAVGATNAGLEELLWRGLPAAVFPGDPVRGWLLPAAGFTAWHLAPLSVRPHPRGRYPILAGAALIGAGYGWVTWSSGSLRQVLLPHALTDSCGLRPARRIWLGRAR